MTKLETTLMEFDQLKAYVAKHDLEDQMVTRDAGMAYDSLVNIIECSTGQATITIAPEESPPIVEEAVIKPVNTVEEAGEISEMVGWGTDAVLYHDVERGYGKYHISFHGN